MAHISVKEGLPGIRSLFDFRPETAEPMCELAEVLLQQPGPLSLADRELIAAYVSHQNDCSYCQTSHGAIAAYHLGGNEALVEAVKNDFGTAPISEKLKALLVISGKVQQGGKYVAPEDVQLARSLGASDMEIHDTVLIAAVFCMCNRYVDGLGTWAPTDMDSYRARAASVAENGYSRILSQIQKQIGAV